MTFKVVWTQAAIESLAKAYLAATTTEAMGNQVTAAISELDRMLAKHPYNVGESRSMNTRVAFALPVMIEFEVFADEYVVVVSLARYIKS